MKRKSLIFSIFIIAYVPTSFTTKNKSGINAHRGKPSANELIYTGNQSTKRTIQLQQTPSLGLEVINKAEIKEAQLAVTQRLAAENSKSEAQFAPGTFYTEIDKWFFTDARGLARQVMAPFKTGKGCNLALGTGDPEENSALFSRVLRSHVRYSEYDAAREAVDFADAHKITIAQDAREGVQKLLEKRAQQLAEQHKGLAPKVSEDKNIQKQQATIIAALERLKMQKN